MPSTNNNLEGKWWIKWWTRETLYGSFMTAPLDELGFFLKLCCLSKQMNYEGEIKAGDGIPLPHSTIAGMLNMADRMDDFERLLKIQKDKQRVVENNTGIITIINFQYYQKDKGAKQISPAKRMRATPETLELRDKAKVSEIADYDPDFIIKLMQQKGYHVSEIGQGGELKDIDNKTKDGDTNG